MRVFGASPDNDHPLHGLYAAVVKAIRVIAYRGLPRNILYGRDYYERELLERIKEFQTVAYTGGFKVFSGNVRLPYEILLPTKAEVLVL